MKYLKKYPIVEKNVRKAFLVKKILVHSIFSGDMFKRDLEEFLSSKINKELSTECIWNVTLFYNQINQIWYRSVVNTFFGFFRQNLAQLHENMEIFIENYFKKYRN